MTDPKPQTPYFAGFMLYLIALLLILIFIQTIFAAMRGNDILRLICAVNRADTVVHAMCVKNGWAAS